MAQEFTQTHQGLGVMAEKRPSRQKEFPKNLVSDILYGSSGLDDGAAYHFSSQNLHVPEELKRKHPKLSGLLPILQKLHGLKHLFLLNRQGKVLFQSANNPKIGDLIASCLVTGVQLKKHMEADKLFQVRLSMATGETLAIFPSAGMIIGLLLAKGTSAAEFMKKFRQASATETTGTQQA